MRSISTPFGLLPCRLLPCRLLPCRLLLASVLLLLRFAACAAGLPPADTTGTYWRARLRAHPRPDSLRVVLLTKWASALQVHDVPTARPMRQAALRLSRQLASPVLVAETLLDLADYHILLAQYDSATTCLREANRLFHPIPNVGGEIRCLGRLGRIANLRGQYGPNLAYTFEALALATRTPGAGRFGTDLKIQLGTTCAQVGDYAAARTYLNDALHEALRYDYPDRQNLALAALGDLCRRQRQWTAAHAYFRQSQAISRRLGQTPHVLEVQLSLARLREEQGDGAGGARLGRQVLAGLQAAHLFLLLPPAQALLARAALRAGHPAEAVARGKQSRAASRRIRSLSGLCEANAVLARAYAARRDFERALEALQQYNAANDSLQGEATRRRLALLEYNQAQLKQQNVIRSLTQQNQLQTQRQELARLRTQRERASFGGLMLLALALAGAGLVRYRRGRQARDGALRTRLAADLHDDVGNLLTQITLQSDLLRETPATSPAQQLARLDRLGDTSRRAARQMADVVWGLHTAAAEWPEVLVHMRDHAHEVLPPAGLAVDFAVTPAAAACRPSAAVCQHLYLIYKEALHNAVKHARGASQVTIRLALETGRLCLSVHDNAPGPAVATARPGGRGLANMRQRAEAVGGTLQHTAGPTGFGVVACLPR